jgi:CelD/BcsL family acetyltransferase involved in cellulose biosynthesis
MRVTVIRPVELGTSEANLWAKFQQESPLTTNPFFSLTFTQTVGRFRSNARVAVIEDGGRIEAFLPFERHALGMGVPIGYPMNDLHGFIGSGAPIDARVVIRKAGLRGWRFNHTPAEQHAFAPFHYSGVAAQAAVINLRDGYDAYLSGRSKNFRQAAGRKRRALERQYGPLSVDWRISTPTATFRQLIDQKSGKYHGTRLLFSDETARRIVEELATVDNPDFQGIVSVVSAGEKPIARFMGMLSWGRLSDWFAAYEPEFSRFSPGTMMYLVLADECANRGIALIDLCPGQDLYKFHLANDSYQVAAGAVWVSRAEAAARKIYRQHLYSTSHGHRMPAWVRSRVDALALASTAGKGEE